MMPPTENHISDLPRLFFLVPGSAAIELVDYYPQFADIYPEAELQTKRWLMRHARPDWVALDVGAHIGAYSLVLSRLLTKGHIHAFEPTETVRLLRRNLAAHHTPNVTVHEVAIGARSGTVEDAIYRLWGSEPETLPYRFSTLDDFVETAGLTRVDFVKIDVDGFDLEVLHGAARTLARFDPWVAVELNHALATRGQSVADALLWLAGQGYTDTLVLDQQNFLVRRAAAPAGAVAGTLRLRFDLEPILMPPAFVAGVPVPEFFAPDPVLHNAAERTDEAITLPGPCWAYAASWPVQRIPPSGAMIVEVEIEVMAGSVGLGCLAPDMSAYIGKEVFLAAAPGPQTAWIFVPEATHIGHLILRNVDETGAASRAAPRAIRAAMAKPATVTTSAVLDHDAHDFALDAAPGSTAPGRKIRILPVEKLGTALGFQAPYVPDQLVYRHDLAHFKTEIDEAGIHRYLYRHLAPRRHLEFGTGEGFGTALCAASCNAEIWTVNLPGEARTGWRYNAAGHAGRVHQLLCDSRDFPSADFAPGFFDTVLVAGGHTPELVANDTEKALPLLRAGGVMIWHGFCPDPAALAASEAARGVMAAWVTHHDRWRPHLTELFWVRPSWLLIGIKA